MNCGLTAAYTAVGTDVKRILRFALWLCILGACVRALAAEADGELETGLLSVRTAKDPKLAEERCEILLRSWTNSLSTGGRIYLALAQNMVYHWKEPDKVIANAEKALRYPLLVDDACAAYAVLGEAIEVKIISGVTLADEAALRRRALVAYLSGLSLVRGRITSFQREPVPFVASFHFAVSDTNDPDYRATRAKYEEWVAARRRALAANELMDWFDRFKSCVAGLYALTPDAEEIAAEGTRLRLDPALLQELIERVQANRKPPVNLRGDGPAK
jgi:hypothetical protein